jgi:FixJ family two-component response regulator
MTIERTSCLLAILDDDTSVQSALQGLMEAEGMCALCFSSAEQFLHSGARHKVGCLIADIQMPGMTGIELQAHLKTERCSIPIIFITGRGDIALAVSAMKHGAIDFYTKPVDGTSLLSSVERTLQQNLANRREATEHRTNPAAEEAQALRQAECSGKWGRNPMGASVGQCPGGEQVWRYSSVTVWRGVCLTHQRRHKHERE